MRKELQDGIVQFCCIYMLTWSAVIIMSVFSEKVYQIVKMIPCGRVATYGQIALLCGNPQAARSVGTVLMRNPYGDSVPCHRVVNAKGELCSSRTYGSWQLEALRKEGIPVRDGRVDVREYGWDRFNLE